VPWAASNATSFVLTKTQTIDALTSAGFVGTWEDVTEQTITALTLTSPPPPPNPGALNLSLVFGAAFPSLVTNAARNVIEGRIRAVMGIYDLTN
jgi:hypothetical protein